MTNRSVMLFARYAELFGAERVAVDLPEGATVATLIDALRALPGGALLPTRPVVAVDHTTAELTMVIPSEAELALLPPLAGG